MPTWSCPHCGAPQPETSRCWVCRRSTTSCATCVHFRRAVAGTLGWCGLDRARTPLRGDELRACWASGAPAADLPAPTPQPVTAPAARTPEPIRPGAGGRTFVPVETTPAARPAEPAPGTRSPEPAPPAAPAAASAPAHLPVVPGPTDGPRWSLWGDAEV